MFLKHSAKALALVNLLLVAGCSSTGADLSRPPETIPSRSNPFRPGRMYM